MNPLILYNIGMNYIYIGKGDFSNPEELIVEEDGYYFIRHRRTDWDILDDLEKEDILNGKDGYYSIEDSKKDEILSSWGGSKNGYRNLNIHHKSDNHGYGEEYDD